MMNRIAQRGITLLEVTVALVIMGGVFIGLNTMIERWSNDTVAATTAQQTRTLGDAASAYIKDNYSAVMTAASSATPALITVATLQGAGYLPSGFALANNYQQNQCVLVLEPAAGQLLGLVVTEGGTTLDDLTLGQVASIVGGSGGGIYSTATTTLQGTQNGWSQAVGNFASANHLNLHCDGATAGAVTLAAGHPVMALWFTGGDTTNGFLHRDAVSGHPELNQMNTALDMNSNDITNVATVALTTAVTAGNACATNGVVARDAAGAVMSCQSATWQPQGSAYWKDPVATFAGLPACNAAASWQTRVVQTPTVGTGPRAYTCNGATWQPLALDNNGSITIAGTATINNLAGNLTVTSTGVLNAACTPNGRIAQDGTGKLLACQAGVWKNAAGTEFWGGTSCSATYSGGYYYGPAGPSGANTRLSLTGSPGTITRSSGDSLNYTVTLSSWTCSYHTWTASSSTQCVNGKWTAPLFVNEADNPPC
jgi:type II secretory pathway pseudopilin PulG